ncbi:hypothetical protein C900_01274 [Fulvivirga imtechensis AK7]|uniref:Rho-binding antiterminator n=1 Tax=Fulvivirga imtechensis AK7 TaxID=1237149 RepID=L8JGK9_9BACT|nr:hypothetical protein [Fulvivirga imtechensis]ELR68011.1 hypothetical protein C900_01274 [Fulvivirga imtechensis AK7]
MDQDFYSLLKEAVDRQRYIKLQYFTDIREFITTMSVAKALSSERNKGEYLTLASGEEIRLDGIVRIDDTVAPQYKDIMDFTCDC